MYVFDVNPLVARSVLADTRAIDDEEKEKEASYDHLQPGVDAQPGVVTVDREDIEEVLRGTVDPEGAVILLPAAVCLTRRISGQE